MLKYHHYHYYFEAATNEVVKAYEYIEDFKMYVDDIEDFCINQIDEEIIRNYSFIEFDELLNNYVNKYDDDVKKLLALKIIVEFLYRHYNTKYFPNIHQCLVKEEVIINRELSKYICIDTKDDSERKLHHFSNGLAWQIIEVYDRPNFYLQTEETDNLENKFQKINWLSNERLIPYLFDALAKHNFISTKNNFITISNHFQVNGKEIKRENLKSNYNSSGYRDKVERSKTDEMKKIDEIVVKIKELNDILSKL